MWSSLLLCLLLTFSVGMVQSLGTLAQSQPLKRKSEGNVVWLWFFCLYLWIYWLYCLFRGAVLRSKGRKIIYGLYDMGLWEKLSAVHYWLIKVRSMTLIIPCEMGSCVDECFEIFCPLLSHIISWTCSSTVLVPIQLLFYEEDMNSLLNLFFFFLETAAQSNS